MKLAQALLVSVALIGCNKANTSSNAQSNSSVTPNTQQQLVDCGTQQTGDSEDLNAVDMHLIVLKSLDATGIAGPMYSVWYHTLNGQPVPQYRFDNVTPIAVTPDDGMLHFQLDISAQTQPGTLALFTVSANEMGQTGTFQAYFGVLSNGVKTVHTVNCTSSISNIVQ